MTARAALPDWPARLSEELAAAYLGVSASTLRAGVASGRYPRPLRDGKRILWARRQLDAYVDAQFGLGAPANTWDGL